MSQACDLRTGTLKMQHYNRDTCTIRPLSCSNMQATDSEANTKVPVAMEPEDPVVTSTEETGSYEAGEESGSYYEDEEVKDPGTDGEKAPVEDEKPTEMDMPDSPEPKEDESSTEEKITTEAKPAVGKKRKKPEVTSYTYESLAEMSRSERKRHREKKRRGDVNKGLDDLMALIFKIDPPLKQAAEERQRKHSQNSRSTKTGEPEAILSRVELITSTVAILNRIHLENEGRKTLISHLARGLLSGDGGSSGMAGAPPPFMSMLPLHGRAGPLPQDNPVSRCDIGDLRHSLERRARDLYSLYYSLWLVRLLLT